MDGFATEAPVGADLKSRKLAPSEQAIDGRGMQLHRGMQSQKLGELADGHDVALRHLFYVLVRCQNQRVPLGDYRCHERNKRGY
jgi:hypothetical protein